MTLMRTISQALMTTLLIHSISVTPSLLHGISITHQDNNSDGDNCRYDTPLEHVQAGRR